MEKNKMFDVLFTANDSYVDILLASIYSFLLNSNLGKVRIHIICDRFTKESYDKVGNIIHSFEQEVYFYPLENYNISRYNIPSWHGTQIANAYLFFGDILKPHLMNIENILYLDGDTITVSDLNAIKNYQDTLYACKDASLHHYYKSLNQLKTYYNSGVISFHVKEWMDNGYQDLIVDFLQNTTIKLSYPDQDIFNCALREKIHKMPTNFNIPPHAYLFNDFFSKLYFNGNFRNVNYDEIKNAKENPKIIHTYGLSGIKPWQSDFNPYHEEYMKYIKTMNPDFSEKELEGLKKYLAQFPFIYKTLLLSRTYAPEKIEANIRKLALKCHR